MATATMAQQTNPFLYSSCYCSCLFGGEVWPVILSEEEADGVERFSFFGDGTPRLSTFLPAAASSASDFEGRDLVLEDFRVATLPGDDDGDGGAVGSSCADDDSLFQNFFTKVNDRGAALLELVTLLLVIVQTLGM